MIDFKKSQNKRIERLLKNVAQKQAQIIVHIVILAMNKSKSVVFAWN